MAESATATVADGRLHPHTASAWFLLIQRRFRVNQSVAIRIQRQRTERRAMLGHVRLPYHRNAEHHMGMPAAPANWTVDMLDALPDDGQRYEIIDGELFVTPAPSDVHQLVVGAFSPSDRPLPAERQGGPRPDVAGGRSQG